MERRQEEKKKKSSLLGKAAKFGLVVGAIQLLRSSTVRNTLGGAVDGVTNRIRRGNGDASGSTENSF